MTDWDLISKFVFPIATALIVAAIGRRLDHKPKLVTYLAHAAGFNLPPIEGPVQPTEPPHAPVNGDLVAPPPPIVGATEMAAPLAPGGQVHVHGVMVRNTGKKTAFNVRIGHNSPVQNYVLEPQVQHEKKTLPTGAWEIVIPALVPNEQVLISYLYFPPVTWHTINSYAKSDDGSAQVLRVLPTPQPPKWLILGFTCFFYLGVAAAAYALVAAAQWCIAVSHLLAPT